MQTGMLFYRNLNIDFIIAMNVIYTKLTIKCFEIDNL